MTIGQAVQRDERTMAVENASYRWAYLLLSFGILASAGYRGLVLNESSWDLLALVVVGGMVSSAYQARQRVLTSRWAYLSLAGMILAAVLAALIVVLRR